MKTTLAITTASLLGLLASACWAQANSAAGVSQVAAVAATVTPEPVSVAAPSYVIGPEDTVHVSVWKEPDLTATLPVRPDGMISLPLLNDVQASGLTPMQLSASITTKLHKYLADPRVTVVVTAINTPKIFVTGEVNHSGPIALAPDMTVLQALASSGFTQFANTKAIYVLRTENGKQEKFPVNYKKLLKGDAASNIVLKRGDTIVVP